MKVNMWPIKTVLLLRWLTNTSTVDRAFCLQLKSICSLMSCIGGLKHNRVLFHASATFSTIYTRIKFNTATYHVAKHTIICVSYDFKIKPGRDIEPPRHPLGV